MARRVDDEAAGRIRVRRPLRGPSETGMSKNKRLPQEVRMNKERSCPNRRRIDIDARKMICVVRNLRVQPAVLSAQMLPSVASTPNSFI